MDVSDSRERYGVVANYVMLCYVMCPGVLYVRPVCARAVRASVLVLVRVRMSPPAAPLGAFLRPV